MTTDPHHNEYLAAVAGLHEQTVSPCRALDGHAIGDTVSFRLRSWGQNGWQTGRIADVNESRNTLLVETAEDIVEVDVRQWPTGELLPF